MSDSMATKLRDAGFKMTAPRRAVLEVLSAEHEHLDAATIYERARTTYPALGKATVYRTLELLTEIGVIRPIYLGSNTPSYTHAEGGHHHLVCSDCGKVIEFKECVEAKIANRLSKELKFHIKSHLLEFYGTCSECTA